MGLNKITMFKGDNKTLKLTVTDQDEVVVDLTGSTLILTAKKNARDLAADALFVKSSNSPGEIVIVIPETEGVAEIYLVPTDTSIADPGLYVYDIELTDPGGKVSTLLKGELVLLQDVTN